MFAYKQDKDFEGPLCMRRPQNFVTNQNIDILDTLIFITHSWKCALYVNNLFCN